MRRFGVMNDDIRALQRKVLELAGEVGPRTRYRMLEIHARLEKIAREQERDDHPEAAARAAKAEQKAA